MKRWIAWQVLRHMAVLAAVVLAFVAGLVASGSHKAVVHTRVVAGKHLTIYVVDKAPRYMAPSEIRRDIPAWEKAANGAFARSWETPQVRILLVKKVPFGGIEADIVKDGPVQGALAYHTDENGIPRIVVYAGTGDYYGFNNSVSFTHELFEMLADPTISNLNYGYPEPVVWVGLQPIVFNAAVAWVSEVCDPVEAYDYKVDGVRISDWVTPNWFNDGMAGGLDHMGVAAQPLQILAGGYAQWFDGSYHAVINFRHAGRDAAGFLKGERLEHERPRP